MSVGGALPKTVGETGGSPLTSQQPVSQPQQPVMPQAQAPAFNAMTDYSMGFGRIFQQPSFFSPFAGYYGYGQPFGGFGGGVGGYGGYGGGYQGGIGSLYGGYSPMPYGGYRPYEQPGNAYARPMPLPMPLPDQRYMQGDPGFTHQLRNLTFG